MEYEAIELRHYLAVIRRWLWLIVLGTFLAGATALVVSFLMPPIPIYQAEAGVLIVRSGSEIVLEPRYRTLNEEDLALDMGERRQALAALATNTTIASQVIEELGSILEPGEREVGGLVGRVKAELDGDLIRILVEADSPEKATAIANAWAYAYEGYVNSLFFGTTRSPADLQIQADEALSDYREAEAVLTEFVGNNQIDELNREIGAKQQLIASYKDAQITAQTQAAEAKTRYDQAEEALAQFLGDNRIDELSREIEAKKKLIASYKDAQTTTQVAAFNQQLATKRQVLADYYADLIRLEQLLADARALQKQLEGGVASPSAATGDALAVMFLRAQAFASSASLPVQLQISLKEGVGGTAAQQAEDVEALIGVLEAQREETQARIDNISSQLLTSKGYELAPSALDPISRLIDQYSQEVLQLQEQLEREQATKQELVQARDLAWGTYQTLAGQMATLDVLASDPSSRLIDQYSQEVLQLQEQLERERATERELTSARDLAWETHQMVARKVAEVHMAGQAAEGTLVRVAVPAVEPTSPIRPRTKQNTLLASVVGAMLAVGASFFIEYLDDTIKTPEDVRRTLGLSTLSSIAPLPAGAATGLITLSQPGSPTSEGFRVLRTQLEIARDKPLKAVVVTSPNPLEGKSTIVANLGAVIAQAGRSTIIVDSDMRRPVLHDIFGLPNAQGLSNALSEDGGNAGRFLQATDVEKLRVLTSGPLPPNPSELLSLPQMEKLIQQLRSGADVLLFDSPAALAVTDAALLAEKVDGVLLVVESSGTRRDTAQQALDGLTRVGANVVGVVLNRFRSEAAADYYYHEGEQGKRKANRDRQPLGRRLLESITRRVRRR